MLANIFRTRLIAPCVNFGKHLATFSNEISNKWSLFWIEFLIEKLLHSQRINSTVERAWYLCRCCAQLLSNVANVLCRPRMRPLARQKFSLWKKGFCRIAKTSTRPKLPDYQFEQIQTKHSTCVEFYHVMSNLGQHFFWSAFCWFNMQNLLTRVKFVKHLSNA